MSDDDLPVLDRVVHSGDQELIKHLRERHLEHSRKCKPVTPTDSMAIKHGTVDSQACFHGIRSANDSSIGEFELTPALDRLLVKVIDEHIRQHSEQLRARLYKELRASLQADFNRLLDDSCVAEVHYEDGQDIQPQSH